MTFPLKLIAILLPKSGRYLAARAVHRVAKQSGQSVPSAGAIDPLAHVPGATLGSSTGLKDRVRRIGLGGSGLRRRGCHRQAPVLQVDGEDLAVLVSVGTGAVVGSAVRRVEPGFRFSSVHVSYVVESPVKMTRVSPDEQKRW